MQPSVSLVLSAAALASAAHARPKSRLFLRLQGGRAHAGPAAPAAHCGGHAPASLRPLGVAGSARLLPPPPAASRAAAPWSWLKIITGGDASSVAAAKKVIANQKAFAQRHGYGHEVHEGNYAHPWIGYWHKIDAILHELRRANPPEVLVWMDLDMLVTNPPQKMLERVLEAYPQKAVLLTEDAQRDNPLPDIDRAKRHVNTGIILVRSGPLAAMVLERLFDYGRQYRDAAYLPQDMDTLHEQDAFNWLLGGPRRHVWGRYIAVMPQRSGGLNLNTFARNLYDTQFKDPPASQWAVGDFTAHCSGLRLLLRERCVGDSAAAAEDALAAEEERRTAHGNETVLGPAAVRLQAADFQITTTQRFNLSRVA